VRAGPKTKITVAHKGDVFTAEISGQDQHAVEAAVQQHLPLGANG